MKKTALLFVLLTALANVFGQKNVRQTASNYLKDGKLDKALEAINQCILDPGTAQDAKTWFLRGNIYLGLANSGDEKFKTLDPDPLSKALDSYKKAIEFDPGKEYHEGIVVKLEWQRSKYYNTGVEKYNSKLYKEASRNFGKGAEVMELAGVTDTASILNAATCASLANENEASKNYYHKLLKINYKTPGVLIALTDIYRLDKDSANALKYVRMGRQLYPDDLRLLLTETDIYLAFNDNPRALNNLEMAVGKDSANSPVEFSLGTIYDNMSNDTSKTMTDRQEAFEKAIVAYQNSIRLNPDNFDGNYYLGALYVNKAATVNNEATKLPLEESAKYDKLKKETDGLLEKAIPYLEKAAALQPADINTLVALKQIYSRTNKPDKLKAVQVRLDGLTESRR
ncbi:MAG: tetratricopeptide repeat protein [Bacteroidetes bacterium]|nr:tetratricopeptide repeat protein [Bacteroidota bacterium]